jgi:dethiobiotin synthetase
LQPIFITGTGTQVGKTVVAAIVTEALQADYWKPVQAGFENGTDSQSVKNWVSNPSSIIHPELYKLSLAASPHISAREESITISIENIIQQIPVTTKPLIIEGAGGIMVPLNEHDFIIDLIKALNAIVIIVSENVLGSINHSLLTAAMVKAGNFQKAGWIFNKKFMGYEDEIVAWSDFPRIGSITNLTNIDQSSILSEAEKLLPALQHFLC